MKVALRVFTVIIALFIAFSLDSSAQLQGGSFGIGANFGSSTSMAMGHFALSENLDLSAGLGYKSETTSYESENSEDQEHSSMNFQAMLRYFLNKGRDVSPYIGGILNYNSHSDENDEGTDDIGVSAVFGGQVFLAKQFAVYGHIALGFTTSSIEDYSTTTTLSLGGSAIGAVFYF
jgi:hypothetical protein